MGEKTRKRNSGKHHICGWMSCVCLPVCVCTHIHTACLHVEHVKFCGTVLYMRNCRPWLKAGISGKLSKACVRKDL